MGHNHPKIAAEAIEAVKIFAFRIDKRAERSHCRLTPAEHCARMKVGGLSKHVAHARSPTGGDKTFAPLQYLIAVGDGDERHGTVDVLPPLHSENSLRSVKPVLCEDRNGVYVAVTKRLKACEPILRTKLLLKKWLFGKTGDAIGFAIAEGYPRNRRMAAKKFGK